MSLMMRLMMMMILKASDRVHDDDRILNTQVITHVILFMSNFMLHLIRVMFTFM